MEIIRIRKEVQEALEKGMPVVALESTIISHGMPYPKNVETALRVEECVRAQGGIPATIGIIDGVGVIGMTPEEIEQFGKRKGIKKVSRRDLPIVFAKKEWGATTVATTMILAEKAGISFFVTGGIGGVHRGAQETFDISADLQELANTNVTVICAGAKAILDLKLTLEYLETYGVPVIGYQTKELPAFYSIHSGLFVDERVDSFEEAARIVWAKKEAQLKGGILVVNPIPEEYGLDHQWMEEKIQVALKKAKEENVTGKEITPFLLKEIVEMTGGESLEANIQLVLNNARVGTGIAVAYAKLKKE